MKHWPLFLLLIAGFGLRLFALLSTINWYNDEPFFYLHHIVVYIFKTSPIPFPLRGNHPCLYEYLLAFLIHIFHVKDIVTFGRWFSLIPGVLVLAPYYFIAKRNFGTIAAFFTAAALAVYDTHILLSVNTLNFAPFYFFLLMAIWAFFHKPSANEDSSWSMVLVASFFFAMANAYRFESWLLVPFAVLYLFYRKKWWQGFVLGAIVSAYPLAYMLMAKRKMGTFFPFLQISGGLDVHFTGLLDPLAAVVWWHELVRAMGLIPLLLGIAGIVFCLIRRKFEIPFFLTLFLSFYLFRTMRHRFTFAGEWPRYSVLLFLFLMPLVFFATKKISSYIRKGRNIELAVSLIVFVLFSWHAYAGYQKQLQEFGVAGEPPYLTEVIAYSKSALSPGDRVCMDSSTHPELAYALVEAKGLDVPPYFFPGHGPVAACVWGEPGCEVDFEQWAVLNRKTILENQCNVLIAKDGEPLEASIPHLGIDFQLAKEILPYRFYFSSSQ